ncbi:ATP-binding protein, partial [Acinetobacter sp. ABJ_C1_1]|uniref:HD domain-containing protein n=1 Tax=Acinetobacter sp. ABJ_C1_1 TaxID=3378321 RepID=UPI0037DC1C93
MSTQLIAHLKKKCEADDNVKILLSQWEFDQKLVGKALENIGGFYPHFSNHNASHSQQILVNIERILGNDIDLLTATDTWLILEAAYWHDVGMLVDAKNAKEVHFNPDFSFMIQTIATEKGHDLQKFCQAYVEQNWLSAIGTVDHPFDGIEQYRQLVAEWFRRGHDQRVGKIVEDPFKDLGITSPRTELLPNRIYRYLGQICVSHGMNFDTLMESLPYKQTGLGTEDCHPRFIGCLLRLGDLFDLDDNRFCPVMAKHVSNIPSVSKHHHDKHLSLREFQLDKRTVKLVAECPDEMSYVETQNWFGWIREEFQNQMSQWNLITPSLMFGSLPTIEQLDVRMQIKNDNGIKSEKILLNNKPMKFTLDEKNGMELLQGANLYKDEFSIYRELIQNAIDATMLRIWLEEDQEQIKKMHPYHPDFIDICKKYPIEIDIIKVKNNKELNKNLWEIIINDNGIGISLKDLNYMQKMAGSSKNYEKKKIIDDMPVWMRPSGEFGIGLHSAFLLCKDLSEENQFLKFTTMNYFSNEKLKIEMSSPLGSKKGYCFITKIENTKRKIGTELRVRFLSKFDFSPYYLNVEGCDSEEIEHNKIKLYKKIIYHYILSKTPFYNFENNDYKWDSERLIAYRFYISEREEQFKSSFRGQDAFFNEFRHGRSVVDYHIDYYGLKASNTLNISRDKWNESFISILEADIKIYLEKYIEDCSTTEKKFIGKLMDYNLDIDQGWKEYKINFFDKSLLLGDLVKKDILFVDVDMFEFLDENFDPNVEYFVMSHKNFKIIYKFITSQIKKDLSHCKIFESDAIFFDAYGDERLDMKSFYISAKGTNPPSSINSIKIKWEDFSSRQPVGYDHYNIFEHLNNMVTSVKYKIYKEKIGEQLNVIRDKGICSKYEILNINWGSHKCIINPY